MRGSIAGVLGVGLALSMVAGNAWGATQYAISDLGTLGGTRGNVTSVATGINASGQVVGYGYTPNGFQHAFLYSDGVMTDLGTLPGGSVSYAAGINASGQVVGYSYTASGVQHAFLYSDGVMADLGTLGGSTSYANGINDDGKVVGCSWTTNDTYYHAFAYSGATMSDLGTLPNRHYSTATAINAYGQIAGWANYDSVTGDGNPCLFSNGTLTDLGSLGGNGGIATGIDRLGGVVGWDNTASDYFYPHAFFYYDGLMTDLGTLGGCESFACGINNNAQIVGRSETTVGQYATSAFIVDPDLDDGQMTDLNSLISPDSGWIFRQASAINDSGWIVGYGTNAAGQADAILLTTPVPEPSTLVLLGIGTISLLAYAWRRRTWMA